MNRETMFTRKTLSILVAVFLGVTSIGLVGIALVSKGQEPLLTNPDRLQEAHEEARASWVNDCLLRTKASSWKQEDSDLAVVVSVCAAASDILFPEKDWNALAKRNKESRNEK